jgi:WD40 repeat protein
MRVLCGLLFCMAALGASLAGGARGETPPTDVRPLVTLPGPSGTTLAFSRDGGRLLAAGGRTAGVWDARTLKQVGAELVHDAPVRSAVMDAAGARVVTAAGAEVRVWDTDTGRLLRVLKHPSPVTDADVSPDGTRVVTACVEEKGTAFEWWATSVWDAESGRLLFHLKGDDPVWQVAFSPDGRALCTVEGVDRDPRAKFRRRPHVWDAATGAERCVNDFELVDRRPWVVGRPSFSPDGRFVAYCFNGATPAALVDAGSGTVVGYLGESQPEAWPEFSIAACASVPGGQLRVLIAGSCTGRNDDAAQVWDLGPGKFMTRGSRLQGPRELFEVKKVFGAAPGDATVTAAALSRDGRRVALAGYRFAPAGVARDYRAGVWDVERGRETFALFGAGGEVGEVTSLTFSPDGRRVAAAAGGRTVVWTVPDRE